MQSTNPSRYLLTILLSCILVLSGYSQLPLNIIPNFSFENGNYHNGGGNCNYYGGDDLDNFNDDIEKWWAAGSSNRGPVDWVSAFNCPAVYGWLPTDYNNSTDKYIILGSGPSNGGIRAELLQPIIGGRYYKMKMKMRTENYGSPYPGNAIQYEDEDLHVELSGNGKILYVPKFYPTVWDRKFHTVQRIFYVDPEFDGIKNIKIFIDGDILNRNVCIDDLELYEQCPDVNTRQNLQYTVLDELEEGETVQCGNNLTTLVPNGDVYMKPDSRTTYKGSFEVRLLPGTNVERGSDFVAKIAPCGKDCPVSDLDIPTEYFICDGNCIKLQGGSSMGMSYTWSANDPELLNYLSGLHEQNPKFCPPLNGQGTYIYYLTTTNACGESTTKTIYVHHDENSNPTPQFDIVNSNLSTNPDFPALSISIKDHIEILIIDLLDCDGNIDGSWTYKDGIDMHGMSVINWSLSEFIPCGCYKIRVKAKNYCYENWTEKTYDWNRSTSPTNAVVYNYTKCENGKRIWCFTGSGIQSIYINLFYRDGSRIINQTYDFNSNPFCVEIPSIYDAAAEFPYTGEFIGCDGSTVTFHGFLAGLHCGTGFTGTDSLGGTWDGGTYHFDGVYTDPQTGVKDSMYSSLSPNPVTDYSTIDYHIPKSGTVKISLLNANFEQTAVLLNSSDNLSKGDYSISFGNTALLNGTNYYMIELFNEQNARYIKRFVSIK